MRKPRIDNQQSQPTPQHVIKHVWTDEQREAFFAMFDTMQDAEVAAWLKVEYGWDLRVQRLSDLRRWWENQQGVERMLADAEQFRTEFAKGHPQATSREIYEEALTYMMAKGVRKGDDKLVKFATVEMRKKWELENEMERQRSLKDKGLMEVAKGIKDNPLAQEKFEEFKKTLK